MVGAIEVQKRQEDKVFRLGRRSFALPCLDLLDVFHTFHGFSLVGVGI
jgi:hypothetical protein